MGLGERLSHAYNAFLDRQKETTDFSSPDPTYGYGYSTNPNRLSYGAGSDRSITIPIYLRMSIDCALVDMRHVKVDSQKRYSEDVYSGLHSCMNVEANIDQSGIAFMLDLYMSLFEFGEIAILPIDMSAAPMNGGLFDIRSWRIGRIVEYRPRHIVVEAYNDRTGRREQVVADKRTVGIVENPFYSVMNEANSTLKRLTRKLALLDNIDEVTASGKLDMFIQLPYPVRGEVRQADANRRRRDIDEQLRNSKYGIAFIDANEKVTQLNRPSENSLAKQVTDLMDLLYTQLGITPGVMNGTASEQEMLHYHNRTIVMILEAVASELRRKFLTKTARTQGHDIMYFRDPFKLVPMKDLAELADKLSRNEIVSANEFRGFIGLRPVTDDPKADMLINSNLTVEQSQLLGPGSPTTGEESVDSEMEDVSDPYDEVNGVLDEVFASLGVDE